MTNHEKNIKEAAVQNIPSCKISWWKNVSEKKNYSYLIYILTLGKMAWKLFSWKKVEYKLKVKYLENLDFEKFCHLNDVK